MAIRASGLGKRYGGIIAVDGLNLEIKQGELFALLGVNGAGKTTTVKMLSCLTRPTEGDATVYGFSVMSEPQRIKERIGVSPQETAVAPNLTVMENLALICNINRFSREKTSKCVAETISRFDLQEVATRMAGKLSGGLQRRVSIAMAMISEPEVLFLDEPTLGLDVIARHGLWDTIRMMRGSTTVILTTHYMEEAEALSDRIGIMRGGRLLAVGTVDELKKMAGKDRFEDAFLAIVTEGAV